MVISCGLCSALAGLDFSQLPHGNELHNFNEIAEKKQTILFALAKRANSSRSLIQLH
jgi:hypothetical protein